MIRYFFLAGSHFIRGEHLLKETHRGFCRKKPALDWALASFKIDPGDLFTIKMIFFQVQKYVFF